MESGKCGTSAAQISRQASFGQAESSFASSSRSSHRQQDFLQGIHLARVWAGISGKIVHHTCSSHLQLSLLKSPLAGQHGSRHRQFWSEILRGSRRRGGHRQRRRRPWEHVAHGGQGRPGCEPDAVRGWCRSGEVVAVIEQRIGHVLVRLVVLAVRILCPPPAMSGTDTVRPSESGPVRTLLRGS